MKLTLNPWQGVNLHRFELGFDRFRLDDMGGHSHCPLADKGIYRFPRRRLRRTYLDNDRRRAESLYPAGHWLSRAQLRLLCGAGELIDEPFRSEEPPFQSVRIECRLCVMFRLCA